jgi:hypothetical protein
MLSQSLHGVPGKRLVVGKTISENKKQRQTGGFRRFAHGRGSSARIWSLETKHCDENAQQNRRLWRKNPTLGDLSYYRPLCEFPRPFVPALTPFTLGGKTEVNDL